MKTRIALLVTVLAAALFGGGCASNSSVENSASLIKAEDIVGAYEWVQPTSDVKCRYVFHENGAIMRWVDGKPTAPAVWEIDGSKVHIKYKNGMQKWLMNTSDYLLVVEEKESAQSAKRQVINGVKRNRVQ